MTNIPQSHPYWLMQYVAKHYSPYISEFYFSYYEYVPKTIVDNRHVFSVGIDNFLDESYIDFIIRQCPEGKELAFHSIVKMNDRDILMHIPMVDMHTASAAQRDKLKSYIGEERYSLVQWYKSGRSFHGYFCGLYDENEWRSLMGTFLLVNQHGLPPTVDPRWIGHRLIAGYGALRWTCNTSQYLELPRLVNKDAFDFSSFF